MQIVIDTESLTEADVQILGVLVKQYEKTDEAEPEKPKAAAAKAAPVIDKKAAAAPPVKEEPEPQTETEEDVLGGGPSLQDAIKRATDMVAAGKIAHVKAALAAVGAAKVSQLPEDKVSEFWAKLDSSLTLS